MEPFFQYSFFLFLDCCFALCSIVTLTLFIHLFRMFLYGSFAFLSSTSEAWRSIWPFPPGHEMNLSSLGQHVDHVLLPMACPWRKSCKVCQKDGKKGRQYPKCKQPLYEDAGLLHWHMIHLTSHATNTKLQSSPPSQPQSQPRPRRTSFEFRHEMFLRQAGTFQKTTTSEEKKPALPKQTSPHRTFPQRRSGLSLGLQGKTERVDMNIKCKRIYLLTGVPTQKQSLTKIMPIVQELMVPSSQRRHTIVFDHTTPAFLLPSRQQCLESHALRKRVQHQWGQPRLVLQSLCNFFPPGPPQASQVVPTLPVHREMGSSNSLPFIPWDTKKHTEDLTKGKIIKNSQQSTHNQRPRLQRNRPKRTLKIQVELAGPIRHVSQPANQRITKDDLPKVAAPCSKAQQTQSQDLTFKEQDGTNPAELSVPDGDVAVGLSTPTFSGNDLYLCSEPSPCGSTKNQPKSPSADAHVFEQETRKELEWHVRRKKLQHLWGLPRLVQGCLSSFLPSAPQWKHHQTFSHVEVTILLPELSFLKDATMRDLDFNVLKNTLRRRWCLPRRILESLRHLRPDVMDGLADPEDAAENLDTEPHSALNQSGVPTISLVQTLSPGAADAFLLPEAKFLLFLEQQREALEMHIRRKRLEHEWSIPNLVQKSLRGFMKEAPTLLAHSNLKLYSVHILHQEPFFFSQDTCHRLELHIQRVKLQHKWGLPKRMLESLKWFIHPKAGHQSPNALSAKEKGDVLHTCLAPLWGLDRSYMKAVSGVEPNLPPRLLGAGSIYPKLFEAQTPFLQVQARENLEVHLRKKRLHHQWGFPNLIQKSLHAFVQLAPPSPSSPKLEKCVHILLQKPLFFSQSICTILEFHIQRMKLQRKWRLPKRVLESIKVLSPGLETEPSELERSGSRDDLARFCAYEMVSRHPTVRVMSEGRNEGKVSELMASQLRSDQLLSMLEPKMVEKIKFRIAKKYTEMQANAIPKVARQSWAWMRESLSQGLPRVITPKQMLQQPRISSLPFLREGEVEKMEMAIRYSQLAPFWGTGAHFVTAVSVMAPEYLQPRRTTIEFSELQTLFLQKQERQALEVHIMRKKIHQKWSLPNLVQRSMKAFMEVFPLVPPHKKTNIHIHIVRQEPLFLPKDVFNHLETHVKKMNLQRQWGLPGKLLQSIWKICPGYEAGGSHSKTAKSSVDRMWRILPRELRSESVPTRWPRGTQHTTRELKRKAMSARTDWSQLPCSTHSRDLSRMQFPLQPNPFDKLWASDSTDAETFREKVLWSCPHFSKQRRAGCEFSEVKTSFLQKGDREALERHIQKKKIQHVWGFPLLVQNSIAGFMRRSPAKLPHRMTKINVSVQVLEPQFLPSSTRIKLEHHIQRRKLQRQWGLPKKVVESLKSFLHLTSAERAVFSPSGDSKGQDFDRGRGGEHQRKKQLLGASGQKKAMEGHWGKRPVKVHLEAEQWGRQAHKQELEKRHLPVSVQAGQKSPSARLNLLSVNDANNVEMNIKHMPLTLQHGLPKEGLDTMSRKTSVSPIPFPISHQGKMFQEVNIPFIKMGDKETLDNHVRRKRLEHQWGIPFTIQRSLQAFAPFLNAPSPSPRPMSSQKMRIWLKEPSFLPSRSLKKLEDSVKRMVVHQKWRLPKRIRDSLRSFSSNILVVHGQLPPKEKSAKFLGENISLSSKGQLRSTFLPFVEKARQTNLEPQRSKAIEKAISPYESAQSTEEGFISTENPQEIEDMRTTEEISEATEEGSLHDTDKESMTSRSSRGSQALSDASQIHRSTLEADTFQMEKEIRQSDDSVWVTTTDRPQEEGEVNLTDRDSQVREETSTSLKGSETAEGTSVANESREATEDRSTTEQNSEAPTKVIRIPEVSLEAAENLSIISEENAGMKSPQMERGETNPENCLVSIDRETPEKDQWRRQEGINNTDENSEAAEKQNFCSEDPVSKGEGTVGSETCQEDITEECVVIPKEEASQEDEKMQTTDGKITSDNSSEEVSIMGQDSEALGKQNIISEGDSGTVTENFTEQSQQVTGRDLSQKEEGLDYKDRSPHNSEETNTVPGNPEMAKEATSAAENPPMTEEISVIDENEDVAEKQSFSSEHPLSKKGGETVCDEQPPITTKRSSQGEEAPRHHYKWPQVPEGGTVAAARPSQAAEKSHTSSQRQLQDTKPHWEIHPRRHSLPYHCRDPKHIQEQMKAFLPHPLARIPRSHLPIGRQTNTEVGSPSDQKKEAPVYRTELCLQVRGGGLIDTGVITKKPCFFFTPKLHPPTEIPVREGNPQMKPEVVVTRAPRPRGRSLKNRTLLRAELHFHLQEDSEQRQEQGCLPQSSSSNPGSQSCGFTTLGQNGQAFPTSGVNSLLSDKDEIWWQLESSLQNRQHRGRFQKHLEISQQVTFPSSCHPAVYLGTIQFPHELNMDQRWQNQDKTLTVAKGAEDKEAQGFSFIEGTRCLGHSRLKGTQEHLFNSSTVAADHLLKTHIAQRALGSFTLPSHVMASHIAYKDMMPDLIRKASRERQERLGLQIYQEKTSFRNPMEKNQVGALLSQENRRRYGEEQEKTFLVVCSDKPSALEETSLQKACPVMEPFSPDCARRELLGQEHHKHTTEADGEGTELSSCPESANESSVSLEAGNELPPPPANWCPSKGKDEGAEGDTETSPISDSQWSLHQEDESQYSTEYEWERIGDWLNEIAPANSSDEPVKEEKNSHQHVEELSRVGPCSKAEAIMKIQAVKASSGFHQSSDDMVSLLGSILEKKLDLKCGMNTWLKSRKKRKRDSGLQAQGLRRGAPSHCLSL